MAVLVDDGWGSCRIENCPIHKDGPVPARPRPNPYDLSTAPSAPIAERPLADNTRTVFKYRVCNGGGVVEEFDRKDLAFEYLEVADHVATDLGLKLFVQECRVEITEKDFGWRAIEPPTPKPEADDVDEYRHWEDCELAACARCDRYDELMDRY